MNNNWFDIKKQFPPKEKSKCIVTNNIYAVDSFGQMSHIWIVTLIQKQGKQFISFAEDYTKIYGITHWMSLPEPSKSK